MKAYRSIEFSKLIWMLDDNLSQIWHQNNILNDQNNGPSNWWLNNDYIEARRYIGSEICLNNSEKFLENSLDFNAMQGGRFNPSRSFGVLYTSSHPLLSALEVLYHLYINAFPLYKRLDKNSREFTSSFNINIPDKLKVLIIAFELEIDDTLCQEEVCGDCPTLDTLCSSIGFHRYIAENFSRDFIFGNDYEISRLIGTYLYTKDNSSFKVPSARIDFEIQDELQVRNYIIPEKESVNEKVQLTGKFIEYFTTLDLIKDENQYHKIYITPNGNDISSFELFLQPLPKSDPTQIKIFRPNIGDNKEHFRKVEIQKYHSQADIAANLLPRV